MSSRFGVDIDFILNKPAYLQIPVKNIKSQIIKDSFCHSIYNKSVHFMILMQMVAASCV